MAISGGSTARPAPCPIRADATGAASLPVSSSVSQAVASAGSPLGPALRRDMEQRFGKDFSHVRIQTGDAAARSAADENARAYTYGAHIVFGAGEAPSDRRLLAHELAHVVQESDGPMLLRKPKKGAENAAPEKPDPSPALPQWKPADDVLELQRKKGKDWYRADDWEIVLSGRMSVAEARALLWPRWFPADVVPMTLDIAVLEPFKLGSFTISGLDTESFQYMEPSIAALFRDRGLVAEDKDTPDIAKARKAFRSHNSDLDKGMENRVHTALFKVTRGNPDLMLAFYQYYSSRDFEVEDISALGDTKYGETKISEDLLVGQPRQPTSDPLKLLGSTLIHEFTHTPQGGWLNDVEKDRNEGKAYAIEVFFAERMGDDKRAEDIDKWWPGKDTLSMKSGSPDIFNRTYRIISKLYEIIDRQGGAEAAAARRMSVEFISKNEVDYSPELRDFISKH